MPAWPSAPFPQTPLADGYEEVTAPNIARTSMEHGPAKHRRRFTAKTTAFTTQWLLTNAEVETFMAFFETTLSDGALSFDFPEPRDVSTTITARFLEPPVVSSSGGLYEVACRLERLP